MTKPEVITVAELLQKQNLSIPLYQRPYKWTVKNVTKLFEDITVFQKKSSYRLGTIVFHEDDGTLNIVDGQQRTITMLLAARALIHYLHEQVEGGEKIKRRDLKQLLGDLDTTMVNPEFHSEISQHHVSENYMTISRIVSRSDFTEDLVDFLLNRCEFVTFTLTDISEAFQFFDSQNARGRDLEPHDLLKAYHLREYSDADQGSKAETIRAWENCDTHELASLFSLYLYRIKNWTRGHSARYFGKNDTGLFKGVNLDRTSPFPYTTQISMAHHYVDHYNQQYERKVDGGLQEFPFQLDQTVINGRRFFQMIAHYLNKLKRSDDNATDHPILVDEEKLDENAKTIMKTLNTYAGRHRTGDRYTRSIFDCLLLYYIDKFGEYELSRVVEKCFIWAYSLRLNMQVVQLASMDNYVLANNLFKVIQDAIQPSDFTTYPLPVVSGVRATRIDELKELFTQMKYYEGS